MTTILPSIPRMVFTIFEPISLVVGAVAPVINCSYFVTTQLAHLKPHKLLPTEQILALQLGNLYFLLCLVGVAVLYTTSEPKVVHAYLLALWVADIGHLAATAYVMGPTPFMDIAHWNATTIGNIGVTTFLLVTRTLYGLGLFGPDMKPAKRAKRS